MTIIWGESPSIPVFDVHTHIPITTFLYFNSLNSSHMLGHLLVHHTVISSTLVNSSYRYIKSGCISQPSLNTLDESGTPSLGILHQLGVIYMYKHKIIIAIGTCIHHGSPGAAQHRKN